MDEGDPQKKIEGMTRIVLRPLANPLPLAFFASGAGSLVLSGLQLGMTPASETRSVVPGQAAYVFPPLAFSTALAFLSPAFEGDLGEQVPWSPKPASASNCRTAPRIPVDWGLRRRGEGLAVVEVFGRANSLNVQKVLWCLGELGVPFVRHDVGGLYGGNKEPDFLARNPAGLVPLLSDDGFDLWESNTIVRYLAARHGAGSLWPEDPAHRALSEKWMDYQLGTVFPAFRDAVLGLIRTAPENRDPEKIAASVRATADTLAILDAHLRDREYVAGDTLTIGDLALGPTIYRWLTLDIDRPPLQNLEAWHDRLEARAPYREHVMVPYRMESPA